MPTPRPLRDRALSAAAALAVAALALSHGGGLGEFTRPATVALIAVMAALGRELVPLAWRALRPGREPFTERRSM
jgi:hypothetical protein